MAVTEQNIFDDEEFYSGYKKIRDNVYSANNVEEKPALFAMMPPLEGKAVLDLGCGYGENCKKFAEMGASRVVGIDISKKMLEVAKREHSGGGVTFMEMNMNELSSLEGTFDVVVSSLAMHYIEDFDRLVRDVKAHLNEGGIFLFSQEHPIATAPLGGIRWKKDGETVSGMLLTDYSAEGVRDIPWIVEHVIKYHRKTSTIINTMIRHGFTVLEIDEPEVPMEYIEKDASLSRTLHAPDYLIVKAIRVHGGAV